MIEKKIWVQTYKTIRLCQKFPKTSANNVNVLLIKSISCCFNFWVLWQLENLIHCS